VAMSGSTALIGAPFESNDAGHAYLITSATGNAPTMYTLSSPIGQADGYFGISVAADSKYLVVGASFGNASGVGYSGAGYVFQASTGNYQRTLYDPNPQTFDLFGASVSITASTVLVGAPDQMVDSKLNVGSAYIFNAANSKLTMTLLSPNIQEGGTYGTSVGAGGSALVVGAPGEASFGAAGAGIAYIY